MLDVEISINSKHGLINTGLLVFENSGIGNYCSVAKDWMPVIKRIHKNTFILDYFNLYRSMGKKGTEGYIYNYIKYNKIGIIFFLDGFSSEFDLGFLEELRQKVFIVGYFADIDEYFYDIYRYSAQVLDLVLVDEYYEKFRFKKWGRDSLFFPSSFNTVEYRNLGLDRDMDVSFVGRMDRRGRNEYVSFLKDNGISVDCYGAGSGKGVISKKEMIEVFNRSKINLNFTGVSHIGKDKIDNRLKQIKGRCQETALTKSFILSEYAPGLEKIFDIGKEIDIFYDRRDLRNKIIFYLNNDEIREKIADRAYVRALRDYDSVKIWDKLLKIIHYKAVNKKYVKEDILIDRCFEKVLNNTRAEYMSYFLGKRKYGPAREEWDGIVRGSRGNFFKVFCVLARHGMKKFINNHGALRKIAVSLKKRIRGLK